MKSTILFAVFFLMGINLFAQFPQAIKYQAVVRDASGGIIANKAVFFKISILSGSAAGTVVYRENHTDRTTNAFGLVDLEIGKGAAESGTFSNINWATGSYFVKIEIFPSGATAWQEMGTMQLLSMPFAMYAKDVQNKDDADADPANEIQTMSVTGNNLTLSKNGGTVIIPGDSWGTQVAKTNSSLTGQGTDASPLGVANAFVSPSWTNIQNIPAGLADGVDNVNDADADTTNEIQDLQLSGTVLGLTKSTKTVTLPSSGGGDNWGTQVVKTNSTLTGQGTDSNLLGVNNNLITPSWTNIQNVPAGFADGVDNTGDADADPTNEIQSLGISGNSLTLTKGGGTVPIPGDNWGSQTVMTDAALTGNGTASTPLKIAQQSAVSGQALKWNGSAWAPANDETGGGGISFPFNGNISFDGDAFSVTNKLSGAISGKATSKSGVAYGVYGESWSVDGGGIYGINNSKSGISHGVIGESISPYGIGVYGKASSTEGPPIGVFGESKSSGGYGVLGKGGSYGVFGETNGTESFGVYGDCLSSTGNTVGVRGVSFSRTGTGVEGSSYLFGTKGYATDSLGAGVYGETYYLEGITYGVKGKSVSYQGYGVYGESTNIGVYGKGRVNGIFAEANEMGCYALYAQNTSTSGYGIGVKGYSASITGEGVEGVSPWVGVRARGTGTRGIGVWAYGYSVGVSASSNVANGYSGYFGDGKFHVAGNAGIGTENPAAKVHVLYNSTMSLPQLLLDENEADYARLMFKNTNAPDKNWTIAGLTNPTDANSRLNFFYSNGITGGDIVAITGDGKVGINVTSPAFTLDVNGSAGKTGGGSWSNSSDIRLKNLVGNYTKGLNEILSLQPVVFTYKEGNLRHLPSDQEQVGFVAQDVRKVFPEAVSEGKDGYLDFNMHTVNVSLVNAVKELKVEIDRLKAENEQVISRLEKLEKLMVISSMK